MYKKLKITRKKKIGSIPGTLLYTGEKGFSTRESVFSLIILSVLDIHPSA